MTFDDKINLLFQSGFKTITAAVFFCYFAQHEGQSIRDLSDGDKDEYQKLLRYFKLMSTGTKTEPGLGLFEIYEWTRSAKIAGRYSKVKGISLTFAGRELYSLLNTEVTQQDIDEMEEVDL